MRQREQRRRRAGRGTPLSKSRRKSHGAPSDGAGVEPSFPVEPLFTRGTAGEGAGCRSSVGSGTAGAVPEGGGLCGCRFRHRLFRGASGEDPGSDGARKPQRRLEDRHGSVFGAQLRHGSFRSGYLPGGRDLYLRGEEACSCAQKLPGALRTGGGRGHRHLSGPPGCFPGRNHHAQPGAGGPVPSEAVGGLQ